MSSIAMISLQTGAWPRTALVRTSLEAVLLDVDSVTVKMI